MMMMMMMKVTIMMNMMLTRSVQSISCVHVQMCASLCLCACVVCRMATRAQTVFSVSALFLLLCLMSVVSPAVPTRHVVPDIDPIFLGKELKKYVMSVGIRKSFQLHSYHYLTKSRAVHARSLHLMSPLVYFLFFSCMW